MEPGLRPRRQDDASVFVLPELAGWLPSPGRRHRRPARASPKFRGDQVPPPLPPADPARAARHPPPAPHHSPCVGSSAGVGLARDAGAVGPSRAEACGGARPTPWSRRRGREAGRSLRRGWRSHRRRGVLLCSCSSTKRGLDTPGLGKWEEGSEGGQRRRRREDRRPPRLTLLGALARRRLTPPPAAGKAESEGERGARSEGWAPRGPADGALRRFCYR